MLLALLNVGIHDSRHDEAQDDDDGVPGGANEPDSLVQNVSPSGLALLSFKCRRSPDKLKETNPSLLIFIPFELLFVFFDKPVLNINNSNLD